MTATRRLTAHVTGSSRLMGADEESANRSVSSPPLSDWISAL